MPWRKLLRCLQCPSDFEIRQILIERIDNYHLGVGIVIGVIEPTGPRVISYGSLGKGDERPLDGDTAFEIGSATEVFTSLLVSDMQRGQTARVYFADDESYILTS